MTSPLRRLVRKIDACIHARTIFQKATHPWDFDILAAYARFRGALRFVQVGSNNGRHGDPMYHYIRTNGWQGILVEPVPYLFEQLKTSYEGYHDRLHFENSAIATQNGSMKFYRLEKSNLRGLPFYYDQLGSFRREVVESHRANIPHFDELFIEDTVATITFADLLEKYTIDDLNLIHIDTEGYDFEVLKMLPFTRLDVDLIMFEHKHLTEADYRKAIRLLSGNGFQMGTVTIADTIAIQPQILAQLRALPS